MKRFSTLLLLALIFFTASSAYASETNGAIVTGGNAGYAWSNQAGWVNFGTTNGAIAITDAGITGYAWNSNYGWINMSPTNGGVLVAANGALLGYGWSSGLGWINFSGVSINSSGKFVGTASGANIGALTFDCANCSVVTDYRPSNFRAATPIQTSPSSGGGGGGGIIVGGGIPDHINAYNVPLVILPQQSGTLEQIVRDGKRVIFNIPKNSISSKTTIIVYEEPLVSDINLSLLPENADLVNSVFYNAIARDENNNLVISFPNYVTITLPVPESLQVFSDIGVYWLDESAGVWRKVSGVGWSVDNATATFRVNHLTKFGIFRILTELLETLPVPAVPPETLPPRGNIPQPPIESKVPGRVGESFDGETLVEEVSKENPPLFDIEVSPGPSEDKKVKTFIIIATIIVIVAGAAFYVLRRMRKKQQ